MKLQEECEDVKGVIRIRKSKKDRPHNGQTKKNKRTNNDLQNIHIKLNKFSLIFHWCIYDLWPRIVFNSQ
jgi:hypothetical protein